MNPVLEFQKFPKIARLNRYIIITEKIDGTNAQILILESGQVFAGSRNRYLTPENDNYGFAVWVAEHEVELREQLGPGRHFGEWWGQGINRGYGLDHRRFSLFNVSRWFTDRNDQFFEYGDGFTLPPECCHVVPILRWWNGFDKQIIESEVQKLRDQGSIAAPGFMQPEGIVVYHTAANMCFKVTLENDSQPKGTQDQGE